MHPGLRNPLLTTAALLAPGAAPAWKTVQSAPMLSPQQCRRGTKNILACPWGNGDHACTRSGLHLAPSLGTFTSVDAASFGGGLRLGWLNAVTADLTVTQVAQGQGLLGTTALPGVLSAGPQKNTRFFFILGARL